MTTELNPQPAVVVMTLEITRAATGKTETVELVSIPNQVTEHEQQKEQ